MTHDDDNSSLIVLGLFLAFLLGGGVGGCVVDHEFGKTAIHRGVAGYNPVTGEWEWTVPVKPELVKPVEVEKP